MSYEESSSSSINFFTRQGREDVKSFKSSILRKYVTKKSDFEDRERKDGRG